MSANCIVTVNIGGFLTNTSRRSFLAACDRWECDFGEIHKIWNRECLSCSKYLAPTLFAGYDRILILDADTVISDHAPNIFDLCIADNTIYAVSDFQKVNQCDAWKNGPYAYGISAVKSDRPELVPPTHEEFFNAGMMMMKTNGTIRSLFQWARERMWTDTDLWTEQGTINVLARNYPGVSVSLLPEEWNHMIPEPEDANPAMFINHYGGWAHAKLKKLDNV